MKRLNLFLLSFMLVFFSTNAKQREKTEVRQIAVDFFSTGNSISGQQRTKTTEKDIRLLYKKVSEIDTRKDVYYIYGRENSTGFVIISGDDRVYDILGYSRNSNFDQDSISDNMKSWLEVYVKEIESLPDNYIPKSNVSSSIKVKRDNQFEDSISPLLGGIMFGQDAPYNDQCPYIPGTNPPRKTATGCVATAMAQVMKYYEWPTKGSGSNSYTTSTHKIELSSNFEDISFDWANITDTYGVNSTSIQKNAIATLMLNCGVSINMNYSYESSSNISNVANALKKHFGYDDDVQAYSRIYYTQDEWIYKLKTEFNSRRPVIYSAANTEGAGHAFVIDGYDSNDFFHINWGWNGNWNGYYRISSLSPSEQGIIGGIGGYNHTHTMLTGIQKPTSVSKISSYIVMWDTIKYPNGGLSRSDHLCFTVSGLRNENVSTFTGQFALGFFSDNDEFLTAAGLTGTMQFPSGHTIWLSNFNLDSGIPAELVKGTYKLYVLFKQNGEESWQKVRAPIGSPSYVDVTLTDTDVFFNTPNEQSDLELISFYVEGKVYKEKKGRFRAEIRNDGKEYYSKVALRLQSKTDSTVFQDIRLEYIDITQNESREINLDGIVKLDPGEYYMMIKYDKTNRNSDILTTLGDAKDVTVLPTPTGLPVLQLMSQISFPDNNRVKLKGDVLTAVVKNTGTRSIFDSYLWIYIYSIKNPGVSLSVGTKDIIIEENETKTIQYEVPTYNLESGDYRVSLIDPTNWRNVQPDDLSTINITLIDEKLDALNKTETDTDFSVYPVPSDSYIQIQTKSKVSAVSLFDMSGQLMLKKDMFELGNNWIDISDFKSGVYVLKALTESGYKIVPFIKR